MKHNAQFFGLLMLLGTLLTYTLPVHASPDAAEIGTQTNPVPVGKVAALADGNAYQFKLGISEVVRGKDAWRRVHKADPLNVAPAPGKEYIMVFVVVRNLSGVAGTEPGVLSFQALTENQTLDNEVELKGIHPDFRVESAPDLPGGGWIIREVYISDPSPLLQISLGDSTTLYFATTPEAN